MPSWYKNTRAGFVTDSVNEVVGRLNSAASLDGWDVENDQQAEWFRTVAALQSTLRDQRMHFISSVLAEYDFRRRGLRIDFILIADGALFILEFKRGKSSAADRDQVMNYCINLVEFHELTQTSAVCIFPIVVSEKSANASMPEGTKWSKDWPAIFDHVTRASSTSLIRQLNELYQHVREPRASLDVDKWDRAPFNPSSTIIDAAVSLYGHHGVSAIKAHSSPQEAIDRCVGSVLAEIASATKSGGHELILVSGAPGAGKTLVGLSITFSRQLRGEAVFVTGNAPLVDVINGALKRSYLSLKQQAHTRALGGYTLKGFPFVVRNANFNIVKAHRFLEHTRSQEVTRAESSSDGRIVVFDEAQRTYTAGTPVNRTKLEDNEASLIVAEMERRPGSIIVLLLGHNQHINTAETGPGAWLTAARKYGWRFAVSDETLSLDEFARETQWRSDPLRLRIRDTHLTQSMRDQRTRNGEIEQWAHYVMTDEPDKARSIAKSLPDISAIRITRSLTSARRWVRSRCAGEDRCGIIASGQGLRLRSEGIFTDEKPDIVPWMLEPADDVRSSNMLEQTQNQYQIQGLEIDYAIVAWDADLRREKAGWSSHKIAGRGWQPRPNENIARRNSYRVLLTRSRKGMIIFVPRGDAERIDSSRAPAWYQGIVDYLVDCGALVHNEA